MKHLSSSIPSQDGPCELAVNNEGLRLMRSFPKLGLVSLGTTPVTSEGPCHPYGHKAGSCDAESTMPGIRSLAAWGSAVSGGWVTQHQRLNSSIKGAPPETGSSRPGDPLLRGTLPGHAGSNLDSPANAITLVTGERQSSWEPRSTLLPVPTLLCLPPITHHWHSVWEVCCLT